MPPGLLFLNHPVKPKHHSKGLAMTFQYTTRNKSKATALFLALTDQDHVATVAAMKCCAKHPIQGFVLVTAATEDEFRAIRVALSDAYPSTNPGLEVPDSFDVPDTFPSEWNA
jgi:hypothetical protein